MKRKNRILIISTIISIFALTFTCLFAGPKEDYEKGLREELSKIFDSPEEIEQFIENAENFKPIIKKEEHPETTTKGEDNIPYDMIIITNEELESDFLEFAAIKNREGIKTEVVKTSVTGETPEDIRQYLKTRKQNNPALKYVLIGGDASVVMPKIIYINNKTDYSSFPTDYYFCNVLSDWISDDEINFEADLYVGRIPADTQEEVQNFINKYIAYRYNGNYSEKYHLIANNLMRRPGSIIGNDIIDLIAQHIETDIDFTYEEDLVGSDLEPQTPAGVLLGNAFDTDDHSFVFNVTHGGDKSITALNINSNWNEVGGLADYPNSQQITIVYEWSQHGHWTDTTGYFYEYLPDYLTNTNPYVLWNSSCGSTKLVNVNNEPQDCIGACFLTDNNGAVAYYASSFLEYPFTTRHSAEDFMDYIFSDEGYEIGKVFGETHQWLYSRTDYNPIRNLVLAHILFGDPSMQIWSEQAGDFNVYRLKSEHEELAVFWVLDGDENPVSSVRCNLISNGDEIFLRGFTDEEGVVEFEVGNQEDISGMEITTIKANFIPYSQVVEEIPYYEEKEFLVYRLESHEEYADFLVLDINKEPIDDVRCELMKGDSLFLREFTNIEGVVEFEIGDNDITKMEFRANKIGFVQYSEIVERIPYYGKGDEDLDSEFDISLLCYPNPMQGTTSICFSTTEIPEDAEIRIYNVKGQLVKRFVNLTGKEKVVWSGQDNRGRKLSNGIYFYRLESNKYKSEIKKILILR